MPSHTIVRVLLGHFLHGVDPPEVNQRASPLSVQLPISSSLGAIPATWVRRGGAQGDAGGHKSPRDEKEEQSDGGPAGENK